MCSNAKVMARLKCMLEARRGFAGQQQTSIRNLAVTTYICLSTVEIGLYYTSVDFNGTKLFNMFSKKIVYTKCCQLKDLYHLV